MTDHVTDTNVGKMTEQEAIEALKDYRSNTKVNIYNYETQRWEYDYMDSWYAINMAIEALQYRTRKIPIFSCPDFMCPKCMTYGIEDLDREKLDYCPNCGQAIDWRDGE